MIFENFKKYINLNKKAALCAALLFKLKLTSALETITYSARQIGARYTGFLQFLPIADIGV